MAGRRLRSRALSVWANGKRVATWNLPTRGPAELIYDTEWIRSDEARPFSLLLPIGLDGAPLKGDAVLNYFDNLLPDSEPIRRRIAQRFQTDSADAFDLLRAIGRDCVGAVQLLADDEAPKDIESIEGTPFSDDDVESPLNQVAGGMPLGTDHDDDFRISLAGAQEKTALLRHGGRWLKPHGATPTTHILKLPLGLVGNRRADLTTSVENEWLCMRLLQAFGLPAANVEIANFGERRVLVVERFDRRMHPGGKWILRLPKISARRPGCLRTRSTSTMAVRACSISRACCNSRPKRAVTCKRS
jgi:serine/threonine-protein kinase HipA